MLEALGKVQLFGEQHETNKEKSGEKIKKISVDYQIQVNAKVGLNIWMIL